MIKSVQKALHILSFISDHSGNPVKLSTIAQELDMNKATCARFLGTLCQEGYTEQISRFAGYVLGPKAFCLTKYGKYNNDFILICHPLMKYLHIKTDCSVMLAVMRNSIRYLIDYIDVDDPVLNVHYNIMEDDLYQTATGRILLANMRDEDIEKCYRQYGPPQEWQLDGATSLEDVCAYAHKIPTHSTVKTIITNEDNHQLLIGFSKAIFQNFQCVGALGTAIRCTKDEYAHFDAKEKQIRKYLEVSVNEINRRLSM